MKRYLIFLETPADSIEVYADDFTQAIAKICDEKEITEAEISSIVCMSKQK